MKTYWGISALNHDASIAVIRDNKILFAGHSERYSRVKNDHLLNNELLYNAAQFGHPDEVVWFEKPILKKSRQIYAGQWDQVKSVSPKKYLSSLGINVPISYVPHHLSHAAAGYFTSGFEDAAIVVVDAIGEWDTVTIWDADRFNLRKIHSSIYPNSIGLLYSAMTQRVGLKPNEEEYILMGMAAYGSPIYYNDMMNDFVVSLESDKFKLKENLHRGAKWWKPELTTEQQYMDIAASVQRIVEEFMVGVVEFASDNIDSENLVLMGGVALNCVANEKVARENIHKDIWIMPNPGDAGSSIGAVAAHLRQQLVWEGPYLGTDIKRELIVKDVVTAILENKIIGIANGKAEFGPRALGNRSLIADPRGSEIKSKVNEIKKRQQFRPFAPIILEELAHEYFDLPVDTSPYMQFTAPCKFPDQFPAICHADGSSRVQTLNKDQNPVFYAILDEFYKRTGCPMLLNTSLNIKGEPLVDSWEDAQDFSLKYNIPIF